jgi:hypothetical protein
MKTSGLLIAILFDKIFGQLMLIGRNSAFGEKLIGYFQVGPAFFAFCGVFICVDVFY